MNSHISFGLIPLINIKGGVAKEGFLPVKSCCPIEKTNNKTERKPKWQSHCSQESICIATIS
jgi:hypothetical protein